MGRRETEEERDIHRYVERQEKDKRGEGDREGRKREKD